VIVMGVFYPNLLTERVIGPCIVGMMINADWQDIAKQLDECHSLYLRFIGEVRDNKLRLVIQEAKPQRPKVLAVEPEPGNIAALFADARPIESDSSCRVFEFIYDEYVSYTISNESHSKYPEEPERFEGNLFRIFSWSYLLEMTRRTSYAGDEHPGPGPLQHHEIPCLNHVIDVITTRPPQTALLNGDELDQPTVH
jgi:hypothetical protein